jgi:hypothetical protein
MMNESAINPKNMREDIILRTKFLLSSASSLTRIPPLSFSLEIARLGNKLKQPAAVPTSAHAAQARVVLTSTISSPRAEKFLPSSSSIQSPSITVVFVCQSLTFILPTKYFISQHHIQTLFKLYLHCMVQCDHIIIRLLYIVSSQFGKDIIFYQLRLPR